ncbi:hypothetical protein LZ575_19510 [Antarcticibacterium sp. 1MA-6-2]|uniref:hypothetical protein n=1 Tax=Antarcticibacterium sp. 1MA-6-2 TaxID=2908210 RepID=UPI001F27F63C|nr:hypothetical protein [Antarcticibacterium sp. 1MA-6-2]UJH90872.1 hypothetical protein LZ575_19510 [Antarcticibacterium sp. 1MA-6-2]
MKKFFVLAVLFLLPITAYLFFASGVNNFAKLPVLTSGVKNIENLTTYADSTVSLEGNISVVAFFGTDPEDLQGNTFNLDQKILRNFYGFHDFQFLIILPEEAKEEAAKFVDEFDEITDPSHWKFAFGTREEVKTIFESFDTNLELDDNLQTPYVFIIDKDLNLRGRLEDEDVGKMFGYDSRSVFILNSKMKDDMKIILAEYRLALKKNNTRSTN